jgi:hypothetical protein
MWAGAVFLLTCGALALAVVGSLLDTRGARPWWLGFTIFGCAYLALAFCYPPHFFNQPGLPTDPLLRFAMPYIGPGPSWPQGSQGLSDNPYLQTGHCLIGLLAGTLGGMLANALFSIPGAHPPPASSGKSRRRYWPAVVGLTSLVLLGATSVVGARRAPGLWAGATVLLTWGILGLIIVGAVYGRRKHRTFCLGASLFGTGYMLLIAGMPLALLTAVNREPWPQLATNRLLNSARPWLPTIVREYPAESDGVAFANARILRELDRPIPMRFPQETPLQDVLAYVVAQTRGPDGYEIPVYVDPDVLQESEKGLRSPVTIDLKGVPIRTSLQLALDQLALLYTVKGGVLIVDSASNDPDPIQFACNDPFLAIGQSVLALLAAGVGGVLAALICDPPGATAA